MQEPEPGPDSVQGLVWEQPVRDWELEQGQVAPALVRERALVA